jgi:hypothetical protein
MGLIRGMARTAVVAGTATAVSNRVSRRQQRRWAEQDTYEELEQLIAMRERGMLTEEEFAEAKARLLRP